MVNLFQGVIHCANCGGRIDVVKKNRDVCKIRGKKNGEKELVTYRQMYCNHGRARTTDCTVNNPAPYIYKSSGLDNELNILKKIQTFRWAEFFTDEKHQGELKIEKDKRTRFLDERNKIKELIEKYNRAESKLFDEGEILSKVQREKRKEAQIKYDELDEKYNRAILDIQNLNRKITGDQAEKDIKKKVEIFIKRDRFITNKRSEFNMWLKQVGISVEVAIGKRLQKYPDNYSFSVGLGMYDFITKEYRGLDQSLNDLVGLGVEVKQVKESEAKSYENYKKQSLELKYDIRFPKPKKEIIKITEEEFIKRLEAKL